MILFIFIVISNYCLDCGFRWQPKQAIILFILSSALACNGQGIMPPMNIPAFQSSIKTVGGTNNYQRHFTHLNLSCRIISPDIESLLWYHSLTIPYRWSMIAVGGTELTNLQVSMTNHAMELFTVQDINSNGLASQLPL